MPRKINEVRPADDYADALVAIWDGKSRGTADVIRRARAKGMPVYVSLTGDENEAG